MIERAQFYEWMVDQKRVLRTYKEDSAVFLIQPGPGSRMSDAQRTLQSYLHQKFPAAGFKCQPAGDDGVFPEVARPLLDKDGR
jgi:hypothetical protein